MLVCTVYIHSAVDCCFLTLPVVCTILHGEYILLADYLNLLSFCGPNIHAHFVGQISIHAGGHSMLYLNDCLRCLVGG